MSISQGFSKKDEKIKKLEEELKEREEECYRYKRELVNNSVMERWKIGEYLHDNLAQQLTSAKILISLVKDQLKKKAPDLMGDCKEILNIIEESAREVRNLSHDIIPMDVEKEGVSEAFKYLKKQAENQHGVKCTLETGKMLDKINRREVATNLYNIAQEAIKNAVVHGEANKIKITIIEQGKQLFLQIDDDGQGFGPEDKKKGRGITIMKHRSEEMGGEFEIKDSKDTDFTTCVSCSLPLKKIGSE